VPMQLPLFPEKTPQTRFAEELNAALTPAFGQTSSASVPIAAEADASSKVEAAVTSPDLPSANDSAPPAKTEAASAAFPSLAGAMPVQRPLGGGAAEQMSSAMPATAAPQAMPTAQPILPVGAPPVSPRGLQERSAAKGTPRDGSATNALMPAAAGTSAPVEASAETAMSENRSGQEGERGGTERGLAALRDAKVTIVRQETHFAPVPPQTPTFQIANRIVDEIKAIDPAVAAQATKLPDDASSAPVKVLLIQLDPPELGAVAIRMSLKNDVLHLQVEASRHDTAKLIERDQDALSGMLRSAGYAVDGLTVQVATGDRGTGSQQFAGADAFNQPAGQHSAGRQPDDTGAGQAWRGEGAPEQIAENGRESEVPGAPGRRGDPVYL
jgi:chemotaxis protein MotD